METAGTGGRRHSTVSLGTNESELKQGEMLWVKAMKENKVSLLTAQSIKFGQGV